MISITPLLPTFEPSDNDLIEMALQQPLEDKIDKLISTIRAYESIALQHNDRGYNLRFSGGKDSCVIDWACRKAEVKHYKTFSNTTIESDELIAFIKKHHPDAEWIESGRGHLVLDRMVEKMNMPTRRGKWCCDEYKNCCSNTVCETSVKIVGVRISESKKRAGAWKTFTKTNRGDMVLAPISYWTDDDVWNLIRRESIPYCELYDQGFTRIGCVGCPINPKAREKEFERWPEMKALWMEGARRCWEKGQTVLNNKGEKYYVAKFKSPEALFEWWMTGSKDEPEANCVFEEMMENT